MELGTKVDGIIKLKLICRSSPFVVWLIKRRRIKKKKKKKNDLMEVSLYILCFILSNEFVDFFNFFYCFTLLLLLLSLFLFTFYFIFQKKNYRTYYGGFLFSILTKLTYLSKITNLGKEGELWTLNSKIEYKYSTYFFLNCEPYNASLIRTFLIHTLFSLIFLRYTRIYLLALTHTDTDTYISTYTKHVFLLGKRYFSYHQHKHINNYFLKLKTNLKHS